MLTTHFNRSWLAAIFFATAISATADNLETTGVKLLRQFDPSLQGSGVKVAQVEAPENGTNLPAAFEVNPATVGQPVSLFRYISELGSSTSYPNSVGAESGHANAVAANFFGMSSGVVPKISHLDNYDANEFYNFVVGLPLQLPIQSRVVNQSFIFDQQDSGIEQHYDDYAAKYDTIFVSGASYNGGPVFPAATSYNGVGVGVSDIANPPVGPTADGRCKPDLVAPGGYASFATPYVSGAAVVLVQAAARGDGGANTSIATNLITVKALLLNGATKPSGWTNNPASPLDLRWGAGVVNVFNSWTQLKAGRHAPIETTSVSTNTPHLPGTNPANELSLVGWDYASITNSFSTDKINHYYFKLSGSNNFTLTATLVWNRHQSQTTINDLNLFLYDTADNGLILSSVSPIDNVEHVTLPQLKPGRYDLQVQKRGSSNQVSVNETYALAFEIFHSSLNITPTNGNSVAISWPAAPTGFNLQSTTSLMPPVSWTPVVTPVSVNTNTGQNVVIVPMGTGNAFFRLQRP